MIGPTDTCRDGIGLLLLDLDGTLVVGRKLAPRVALALREARSRGCRVATATGRPYQMILPCLKDSSLVDYHVCANGGLVCRPDGSALIERAIPPVQALALIDALAPMHPGWNAFFSDKAYFEWAAFSYIFASRRDPSSAPAMRIGLGDARKGVYRTLRRAARVTYRILFDWSAVRQVRSVRRQVERHDQGPYKMGCSFASCELGDRAAAVLRNLGGFEVARMSDVEFELTLAGVDKGTSALWLEDHVGVSTAATVAFGDSENDLPLRKACGTLVAMGNATDRLTQAADDTCETVWNDGVARWLERAMGAGSRG